MNPGSLLVYRYCGGWRKNTLAHISADIRHFRWAEITQVPQSWNFGHTGSKEQSTTFYRPLMIRVNWRCTNSLDCLLLEERLHKRIYCTKYGWLIDHMKTFEPQWKCILKTHIIAPAALIKMAVFKPFPVFKQQLIWGILTKFGCQPQFISVLWAFHDGLKSTVSVEGQSAEVPVSNGDVSWPESFTTCCQWQSIWSSSDDSNHPHNGKTEISSTSTDYGSVQNCVDFIHELQQMTLLFPVSCRLDDNTSLTSS